MGWRDWMEGWDGEMGWRDGMELWWDAMREA
jgi:hypothetical protein